MRIRGGYSFETVVAHARRAGQGFLDRSGAFLRKAMRSNVRRTKHKVSAPGNPPNAHGEAFKASILFDVDPLAMKVYVGPRFFNTSRKNERGQTVPDILEHGGRNAKGLKGYWYVKRYGLEGELDGITTRQQLASWVMGQGKGPFVWGETKEESQKKMDEANRKNSSDVSVHGGKNNRYRNYKRYSPIMQKYVYLHNIRVQTPRQAIRVAKTILEVFGMPTQINKNPIEARPLASYTMAQPQVRAQIMKIYQSEMNNYSK